MLAPAVDWLDFLSSSLSPLELNDTEPVVLYAREYLQQVSDLINKTDHRSETPVPLHVSHMLLQSLLVSMLASPVLPHTPRLYITMCDINCTVQLIVTRYKKTALLCIAELKKILYCTALYNDHAASVKSTCLTAGFTCLTAGVSPVFTTFNWLSACL